jgi:phosphate transport system substrate-binding protein
MILTTVDFTRCPRRDNMKQILLVVGLVLLSAALAFAGGSDESESPDDAGLAWIIADSDDDMLPGVNPLEVTGDIVVAGSSTVFPMAEEVIARWYDEGYSNQYSTTYTSIGSGAGFERFGNGESDISGASRPIREAEVENARSIGLEPLEFNVATDALAVVVNPANTWATDMTIEELALAFSTAETWADVRDGWPEIEIIRYSPGTDSGTFDYFVEEVFDEDEAPILNSENIQFSEDDNVLVQGVEGDEGAIGYFGFAYFVEESDRLSGVNVEGVTPNAETVDAGEYPLARPLFLYSDAGIMTSKPQVAAFIAFFLTYAEEEAADVGYFPASPEKIRAAKQQWLDVMEGMY